MAMAAAQVSLPALRPSGARGRAGRAPRLAVRAVASPPAPSSTVWTPDSWRSKKALQMPEYHDPKALADAVAELRRSPPLIFAGEVRGVPPFALPRAAAARGCGGGPRRKHRPSHFLVGDRRRPLLCGARSARAFARAGRSAPPPARAAWRDARCGALRRRV